MCACACVLQVRSSLFSSAYAALLVTSERALSSVLTRVLGKMNVLRSRVAATRFGELEQILALIYMLQFVL